MGTSTRRINKKIKDLLQQKNPETIEQVIPDVYKEVMRSKAVNRFYSEEFSIAIGVGIRGIKAINEGTFKQEFHFVGNMDSDQLTKQKIIESIIDLVGEETFEEDSLVKTALKFALAEAVLHNSDGTQLQLFVEAFCCCLIYLLISEQSAEVLGEYFSTISATQLDDQIRGVAKDIVNNSLTQTIQSFISGTVNIQTLIEKITEKATSLDKVGEI